MQDNYYNKLKALLKGLEVENIDHLLEYGDVQTFTILGEMITDTVKKKLNIDPPKYIVKSGLN